MPEIEVDGETVRVVGHSPAVRNLDEFIETLWEIEILQPDLPVFLLAMKHFHRVCCTAIGIREPYLSLLITLESACSDYQVLPYGGGLMEQPQFLYDAFQCVRVGRNEYFRIRDEEWKSKIGKGGK